MSLHVSYIYSHCAFYVIRDPDQYRFRLAELPSDLLHFPQPVIQLENTIAGEMVKSNMLAMGLCLLLLSKLTSYFPYRRSSTETSGET